LFPERRRRLSERVRPGVVAGSGLAPEPVAPDRRRGKPEAAAEDESPELSFAILALENVECSFGGVLAVDGATFGVPRGEITGLIGPNGAGKSTILNLIGGAVTPGAGQIWYEGRDIAGAPSHRLAREGIIRTFQNPRVFEELSVLENLVAAARGARGSSFGESLRSSRYWAEEERHLIHTALELLDRCDMTNAADEYAGQLSGGQKRLLELMRGFMAEPKLLLLDEPFAGILPSLGRILERELKTMRDKGITMLVVEHDLDTIERLTDSVIVMARGSVLTQGRMADLRGEREVLDAYVLG
jgi:branched-chain amino acid transport system ATP-binding protein